MKRFLIVTSLLVAISSQAALANVKVNGLLEPVKYIVEDGNSLVGIRDMANLLGAEVTWSTPFRSVTIRKGSDKVILYVDTNQVDHNGAKSVLPVSCKIVDGAVLIPLRFVSETFGAKVDWDAETSTVLISTGATMLETKRNLSADTTVLTFDQAYEKVLKKNSDLKSLSDTVNLLDDTEDKLYDSLQAITDSGSYTSMFPATDTPSYTDTDALQMTQYKNLTSTINIMRSVVSTDKSKEAVSMNEQIVKDGLSLSLISSLCQIDSYEMSLAQLQENISIAQEKIKNMELKYSLGYESEYNLNTQKNSLKTLDASYEQLKLNYADAKVSLNKLMGLDAKTDVYVEYSPDIKAFDNFDLESYVFKSVNNDISIKLKQIDYELAEYNLRTNVVYSDESKIDLQNKSNKAKRALEDAKTTLETNLRKAYNDIGRLKQSRQSLEAALHKAQDDYNSVVSNYEVGNVTLLSTKEARVGVLKAEIDLKTNEQSYEMLLFTFERPYLLGASKTS